MQDAPLEIRLQNLIIDIVLSEFAIQPPMLIESAKMRHSIRIKPHKFAVQLIVFEIHKQQRHTIIVIPHKLAMPQNPLALAI